MKITQADVLALKSEPSATTRADLAQKVAQGFNANSFTVNEAVLAVEIFRLLLKDVEVKVRRALSENLKHNMRVPHDVALRLAKDVSEVSVPMLEYSHVLSEDDLIEIATSTKVAAKLLAIARRGSISHELARALINSRNENVLHTLITNGGASIAELDMQNLIEHSKGNENLLEALVARGGLSIALVDKLFDVVSDRLKTQLTGKYRLNRKLAEDCVSEAHNWARSGTKLPEKKAEESTQALVEQLYERGELDFTLLIRALCNGDMIFFEMAIAKMAGIPLINARILMLDPGPLGFKALYNICSLPPALYEAIKTLLNVALEVTTYGKFHREDFQQRMLERLMAHRYDQSIDQMPYLMSIIGNETRNAESIH